MGTCLIGVTFPRVEEMCYFAPQGSLISHCYSHCPQKCCSTEARSLLMPGYPTAAERLAHHLQNCWTVLLRAAVEEGAQTGNEVGVPF